MTESTVTLKCCPFCGWSAKFVTEGTLYAFKVKCTNCGATSGGSAFRNDEYNAKCWNNRCIANFKVVEA